MQTQRLFGQQSIAGKYVNERNRQGINTEFSKLHVDPLLFRRKNELQTTATRKHGLIINSQRSKQSEIQKIRKRNKEKFQVPKDVWQNIKVPYLYPKQKVPSNQTERVTKVCSIIIKTHTYSCTDYVWHWSI